MAQARKYQIPSEYASALKYAIDPDQRSDEEILAAIHKHVPVATEKNIWAYWDKGITAMPGWCKRNVAAWARICGPSWSIRVLDNIPDSPNYALKFVSPDIVPGCFVQNTMDGPYTGPHAADFLRGALLITHGGCFMDVGNILIRSLDRVCWDQLADDNSPFQASVPWMYGIVIANHFVASRKGDPFIRRWHELFITLWKDKNDYKGLIDNPLISFGKSFDVKDPGADNFKWDFSIDSTTMFEYISQVLCWTRMCMLGPEPAAADGSSCFNPSEYWQNNILIFDVLKEDWGSEYTIGFDQIGQRMFRDLTIPVEPVQDTDEYKEAHKLVWRALADASMQKLTHGKGIIKDVQLGTLWDKPENEGKDCLPGTFGELLRWGAVNLVQTRKSIAYVKAPAPPVVLSKGYLEP